MDSEITEFKFQVTKEPTLKFTKNQTPKAYQNVCIKTEYCSIDCVYFSVICERIGMRKLVGLLLMFMVRNLERAKRLYRQARWIFVTETVTWKLGQIKF